MWTVVRKGMLSSVCRDCNMNSLSSGFQGLGRVFRRSQTHMRAERSHRRLVFRTSRVGSTELESPLHVARATRSSNRSEEHTSELQSRLHLVCRLLLEKKKTSAQN